MRKWQTLTYSSYLMSTLWIFLVICMNGVHVYSIVSKYHDTPTTSFQRKSRKYADSPKYPLDLTYSMKIITYFCPALTKDKKRSPKSTIFSQKIDIFLYQFQCYHADTLGVPHLLMDQQQTLFQIYLNFSINKIDQ